MLFIHDGFFEHPAGLTDVVVAGLSADAADRHRGFRQSRGDHGNERIETADERIFCARVADLEIVQHSQDFFSEGAVGMRTGREFHGHVVEPGVKRHFSFGYFAERFYPEDKIFQRRHG